MQRAEYKIGTQVEFFDPTGNKRRSGTISDIEWILTARTLDEVKYAAHVPFDDDVPKTIPAGKEILVGWDRPMPIGKIFEVRVSSIAIRLGDVVFGLPPLARCVVVEMPARPTYGIKLSEGEKAGYGYVSEISEASLKITAQKPAGGAQ